MFGRFLVPLDGSDAARVALIYAASIPSSSVRLLAVLPSEDAGSGFPAVEMQISRRDEWRAAMEGYLSSAAAELEAQGRQIEIEVVIGQPADRILEYSRDADLIVMTTNGYGGRRRALYGSVADRIARHSETPVLLIRGGEHPITTRPVQRVVVPLDGSELAEAALPMAAELADTLGIAVLLVRALNKDRILEAVQMGSSPVAMYAESLETVRHAAFEYLNGKAQELRNRSIVATTEVRDGPAAQELIDVVVPGDVLVMTTHGRSGVGRWLLGSVSERVVQTADVPVLLIRSKRHQES